MMSEYTNPTGIHRDCKFNRYRAQSSGGVDSFDFNGFYQRAEGKNNIDDSRRRTISGLEDDEDNSPELETKVEQKDEIPDQSSNEPVKKPVWYPSGHACFGGLG